MDRIRCGVIGLGWFGEHHVDALQQLPQVEVAAVCTRTESRLREVAAKYKVPKSYTDYHKLLADKSIDMVTVVTHIKEHVAPTVDALAAGKHVFLEKPMADSIEDCDPIIAAAAKGRHLLHGGTHLPLRYGVRVRQGRDRGGEPRHDPLDARAAEPGQVDHALAFQEDPLCSATGCTTST